MSRTEHSPAVLLRSVVYGEADRIVTLWTERHGKVSLVARGARKSARRFAGALEPYAIVDAELALGRGDLGRLAEARVVRAFPRVLASLERMSVAAAGLELVREAVPDREPDPRFMPLLERFFEVVEELPPRDELRIAFTLRVLALVGLGPNLDSCGRCGRRAPEGKAALFDPALASVVCRACGGGSVHLSGALRARLGQCATRSWDVQAAEAWGPEVGAARDALDELLARHLSHRLSGAEVLTQVREVAAAYERATDRENGGASR